MDITTFPDHITRADIGRHVAAVRGMDWEWYTPCEDTIIVDVRTCYCPPTTLVKVASETAGLALWFASTDIRLLPLELEPQPECNCVLPEHSCPACRAAARRLTDGEMPY